MCACVCMCVCVSVCACITTERARGEWVVVCHHNLCADTQQVQVVCSCLNVFLYDYKVARPTCCHILHVSVRRSSWLTLDVRI